MRLVKVQSTTNGFLYAKLGMEIQQLLPVIRRITVDQFLLTLFIVVEVVMVALAYGLEEAAVF